MTAACAVAGAVISWALAMSALAMLGGDLEPVEVPAPPACFVTVKR